MDVSQPARLCAATGYCHCLPTIYIDTVVDVIYRGCRAVDVVTLDVVYCGCKKVQINILYPPTRPAGGFGTGWFELSPGPNLAPNIQISRKQGENPPDSGSEPLIQDQPRTPPAPFYFL